MVTINSWGSQDPAQVAKGGTGSASFTAYGPVVAASTTTGALTSVAPSATSGVPLVSAGNAANPTFGTAVVAGGGTGLTSTTAYAVVCGGTTSTAALQPVASVGSAGQVLTSNGAGALPTFQAAGGTAGTWVLLATNTPSSATSSVFTTGISSTYNNYVLTYYLTLNEPGSSAPVLQISTNGGSSYIATNYTNTSISSSYVGTVGFPLSVPAISFATSAVGMFYLNNATSAATNTIVNAFFHGCTSTTVCSGLGTYSGAFAVAVNALRIVGTSGTQTMSGTIKLYGISQ